MASVKRKETPPASLFLLLSINAEYGTWTHTPYEHMILSHACLPIPATPHIIRRHEILSANNMIPKISIDVNNFLKFFALSLCFLNIKRDGCNLKILNVPRYASKSVENQDGWAQHQSTFFHYILGMWIARVMLWFDSVCTNFFKQIGNDCRKRLAGNPLMPPFTANTISDVKHI